MLIKNGHDVIITARKEDTLIELLKYSNLNYILLPRKAKKFIGLLFELISRSVKLFLISRRKKIECYFGMSILSIIIANFFKRKPVILFTEQEDMGLKSKFVFKFANKIFTPIFFNGNLGEKHEKFNSLLQLSYLHPKYFSPDKKIVERFLKIKIDKQKYFILRFCDWNASHDLNQKGFSKITKYKLINFLTKFGKVFILDESNNKDFQSYKPNIPENMIHHFLAFSSLNITETTSISIESGLLGVPVVRCSTLVNTRKGGAAIFEKLEQNNLVYSFKEENEAFQKVIEIVEENKSKIYWIKNRDKFIEQFDRDIVKKLYLKIIES